jgi:hypothetical protein
MKLVATYNFGSISYAEHTVPFMRRYAQTVGADFKEFCCFPNQSEFGSSASWFHLEAIRYLAGQSRYDWMLLLDADALVLPSCPDVFERAEGNLAVVQDMGMPWVDEKFQDWCAVHYRSRPPVRKYFNAGVMVVPRSAAVQISQEFRGPFVDHWPHDQHYLNWLLPDRIPLTWLSTQFNWMAPQHREASWQQHIIHFSGISKGLIPEYVRALEARTSLESGTSNPAPSLRQLARKYGTDKGTDHTYLEVYEQLFERYRQRPVALLEIGIYHGESLRLWREYFPKGRITGIDVSVPSTHIEGCELLRINQTDRAAIDAAFADESLDIIIDDASHRIEDQIQSVCWLWPKLKPGGLYLIEDVVDAGLLKHFSAFRPLMLDRSHLRPRGDDILVVLAK